jgi:ribosomal protein L11 methyltransferase
MAFGTGQHATTRGCLELLEWATATRRITRALDVGTGTGVLAIALAKLGVPDVWAIDNDPAAGAITHANAARNAVGERIGIGSRIDEAPGTFSLIVANLFAYLLEELAARFAAVLAPDGVLICSGLLVADEARVRAAYRTLGLETQRRHEEADWVTLALHRVAPQ